MLWKIHVNFSFREIFLHLWLCAADFYWIRGNPCEWWCVFDNISSNQVLKMSFSKQWLLCWASGVVRLVQKPVLATLTHVIPTQGLLKFLKLLKLLQSWFRFSFGTLGSKYNLSWNSCKIQMWMHSIKARMKVGASEINTQSGIK